MFLYSHVVPQSPTCVKPEFHCIGSKGSWLHNKPSKVLAKRGILAD